MCYTLLITNQKGNIMTPEFIEYVKTHHTFEEDENFLKAVFKVVPTPWVYSLAVSVYYKDYLLKSVEISQIDIKDTPEDFIDDQVSRRFDYFKNTRNGKAMIEEAKEQIIKDEQEMFLKEILPTAPTKKKINKI